MYREAEFEEGCNECGQPAPLRCARCGDPCCARHVYSDDPTCSDCESEFLRMPTEARSSRGALAAVGGGYAVFIGAAFLVGLNVLSGLIGGLALGGFMGLRHAGGKRRRQAYLAERRKLFLAQSTDRQLPSKT